jgi:carbonic anhydrase
MRKHFVIIPCLLLLAACTSMQTPLPLDPGMSSEQLWNTLMKGNDAYVGGSIGYGGLVIDREKTGSSQNPPVTILSCADSRVPPELAFHRTVGDLFITREAGNVADEFTIASIEYGILNNWTRMIVVLGHESCGAVEAAIAGGGGTDPLKSLVARIQKSFPKEGHCKDPKDPQCVHDSVVLNARASAKYLSGHSETIHTAVCGPSPTVTVVTAYYNLVSGRVEVIPWPAGDSPCHVVGIAE